MNTKMQPSHSHPLSLPTGSDFSINSRKPLSIPSGIQSTMKEDAKSLLLHTEQACSPSSTVYPDEGADFSDSVSALAVSRQSSTSITKKVKPTVSATQSAFSTALGSGMVVEEQSEESESVKDEKMDYSNIPSRKSTADESALDEEEEEDRSEEGEDSDDIKDWNEKKEKLLRSLASKCKYDWKKIAKKFNQAEKSEVAPAVLKQKYKGLVNAAIPLRVKFSHQEDLMIAKYFELYGCDWVQIATHFTDRNAMMLKNRYYSHIRKRNLLDTMLEEVNGGEVKKEEGEDQEDEKTTEENVSEQQEANSEEDIPAEPMIVKQEAEVKIQECHKEKSFCDFEPFYGNRTFLMRRIYNTAFFDMENALRTELHHKITSYY